MTMCVNVGHGDAAHHPGHAGADRGIALRGTRHDDEDPRHCQQSHSGHYHASGPDENPVHVGGADANENAIKLARGYTGRHKILTRYRSYHGATMGAMAATGDPRRQMWEPLTMPGVVHFLDPYRYRSTFPPHKSRYP